MVPPGSRRVALFGASAVVTVAALLVVTSLATPPPSVIVLIGLESTRADHVGPCYGYDRVTAPNVCGIADDGVLFEDAHATGSWTPVSVPSLMTARTPREVGLSWFQNVSFSENLTTFPEVLARHGYRLEATGADLFREIGLLQGFEAANTTQPRPSPRVLLTYFQAPHTPYVPDERFRLWDNLSLTSPQIEAEIRGGEEFINTAPTQTIIDLYDEEIRGMDEEGVGGLVERLKERGLYRGALIVVFGDHGEAFGEHGIMASHGGPPYQEITHVPLVVKFPGNRFAGTRVEQPVSLVDVPHTLFDYLGINTVFGSVGTSLLPRIRTAAGGVNLDQGGEEERTVFAAMQPTYAWMVRDGNWTYLLSNAFGVCVGGVEPGRGEPWGERLFDASTDPWQQEDVAEQHPAVVQDLRGELCAVYNVGGRNASWFVHDPVSDQMQEILGNLGSPYSEERFTK